MEVGRVSGVEPGLDQASDVEFDRAKNGKTVVKVQGRFLSSSFDPEREAVRWCETVMSTGPTDLCCVVLGLGSGYHIVELQNRVRKPVVAIDTMASLRGHFEEYFRDALAKQRSVNLNASRCLIFSNEESFRMSTDLDFLFQQPYRVIVHAPSFDLKSDFYLHVRKLLIGRDLESLRWQLERRGLSHDFNLQAQFPIESVLGVPLESPEGTSGATRETLSIRHLQEMKTKADANRPQAHAILNLLGELVR